ncbi:MAG: hypothetical protein MJ054_01025, partial [Clostridia bacterium]|nr:hypothetical protein [Clostridia bacterium]
RGRNFEAWCESVNDSYAGVVATNIANNAIDYYIQKTTDAINSQANFPVDDMESTLVSSGVANVYYIPQDIANNLFTVSHILIGFTDEQKNEYKRIQNDIKDAENNHTSYDAQNDLNKLYGETMSNGVSASDILIEVDNALNKADLSEKYHVFREFINKYNSDPGMQNLDQLDSNSQPQYEYLMSTTAEKNKMVEAFTKASIDLFNDGVKGAISDLVWTDYGAHIIMYTRDVSDFVATGVSGMEESTIQSLKIDYEDKLFATLTSYGNRTLFDTLVDAYFVRNYSNYRTSKLNEYKSEHQINVIKSEFKNFLKK